MTNASGQKGDDALETPQMSKKELVAARVGELLRITLDGAEDCWDWCEYVREKESDPASPWFVPEGGKPLSYSQIRRYVAKVDRLIAESCRASRKKLFRRHLAKRRNLYAKAVSQGDVRAALAVLDSEAKLFGLFEFDLIRRIEALEKQAAEANDP
jgi:hypothetical protein